MGYCVDQVSCTNFKIEAKNFHKALKAIKALHGKETIKDSGGSHFSWVDHDFHKARSLPEALDMWRWRLRVDDDGDGVELYFEGEKLGDDEILLNAIAPFVEAGAEIAMAGEDGARWKWVFNGKTCVERAGRIVYDDF